MSRRENQHPNPSRLQKPPSYQADQQRYGNPPPQAYNGPAPPPQAYYPGPQQQGLFYNAPGMTYGAPQQQQHILLGFINGYYQQRAIYGPPGATYDLAGNVYFDLGNDERSYMNREAHDRYQKQRDKQWEKDLCRCQ